MEPLLKDPILQASFDRDGFVVAPLLSTEQVNRLLGLYQRHISADQLFGLYESSRHNTYQTNRQINEAIRAEVEAAGQNVFLPSRIYGGTFMVKSHNASEMLPLHQDWSVIEEGQYSTLFIWCPLVDVTVLNGCLFVLPGSHKYFESLRSGTYPSDRFLLPTHLHRYVRDVPLKAGEAIFYSDSVFHGSYPNNGAYDRIVVTARVIENGANLAYFHKESDREVNVYFADEQFYLTHIDALAKGQLPTGARKLYKRAYKHVTVTNKALEAKIMENFQEPVDTSGRNQLFKDATVQTEFESNGYAVIDLLNSEQVEELNVFYGSLKNAATPAYGFQVSLDNESPDFVRAVSQHLIAFVRDGLEKHFQNHRIFTASFVTKAKNPLGVVPPHQDWTFVDESRFWSATIWCPLLDVNIDNGALGVIKGSHRFYDHVRPSPSPQYAPPFKDQLFSIFPYLHLLELRAGQAVIFDNRTLHASPPNTTDRTRLAFGIGITQKDATIRHYYLLPGRQEQLIEGYEVEPEFFFHYNNAKLSSLYESGRKPEGLNSLGIFKLTERRYETSELVRLIKAAGNEENGPLVQKMADLFNYNLDGTKKAEESPKQPGASVQENLPFWKVYTLGNIVREIRYRLSRYESEPNGEETGIET